MQLTTICLTLYGIPKVMLGWRSNKTSCKQKQLQRKNYWKRKIEFNKNIINSMHWMNFWLHVFHYFSWCSVIESIDLGINLEVAYTKQAVTLKRHSTLRRICFLRFVYCGDPGQTKRNLYDSHVQSTQIYNKVFSKFPFKYFTAPKPFIIKIAKSI